MTQFFSTLKTATAAEQALMHQAPLLNFCRKGEMRQEWYTAFLTQAYHHVKHTVPLLMACGGRLPEKYEHIRVATAEYIADELGHQEWILNDLKACGANVEDVRQGVKAGAVSRPIELMVSYLYHQIDRHNPLALFGMVWVLEGTSVGIGGEMATLIQNTLKFPDAAMTYLRSHSALDIEHLKFFENTMNTVTDSADQQAIIDSANMIYRLYGQMLYGITEKTSLN